MPIETVERSQMSKRPAIKSGRHRARARQGARRRQGTHAGVRGHRHRHAPGRRARLVHRAKGLVRPGRRAHLPAALADRSTRSTSSGRRRSVAPSCYFLRDLKGKAARMKETRESSRSPSQSGMAERPAWICSPLRVPDGGSRHSHARERAPAAGLRLRRGSRRGRSRLSRRPGRRRRRSSWIPRYIPGFCDSKTVTALERDRSTTRSPAGDGLVGDQRRTGRDRPGEHPSGVAAGDAPGGAGATPLPNMVLVDAFRIPDLPMAQRGIVHGDSAVYRHRGGLDRGQGHARSADARSARPGSSLRIRPSQRLRHAGSPGGCGAISATRRASPFVQAAVAL